jgi:hypothetical protein
MGPTDAECTIACIDAHGALYVLYDGKNVFTLSDQQQPARFAGRRVKIVGTLDAKTKTIAVQSITAITSRSVRLWPDVERPPEGAPQQSSGRKSLPLRRTFLAGIAIA